MPILQIASLPLEAKTLNLKKKYAMLFVKKVVLLSCRICETTEPIPFFQICQMAREQISDVEDFNLILINELNETFVCPR